MNYLLMIKKSTASILNYDDKKKTIFMKFMMFKHHMKTSTIEYQKKKTVEIQFHHQIFVK